MERTNIFLGGFMAAGKTSTGRELGLRTGRPFIDVDELIEEREGMPVAEIFRQRGEPYFRRIEAATILELCELEHMVIAMGGGALVNSRVKERVLERGRLVILDVLPETVIERAQKEKDKRPLMDPRNIRELMEKRRGAYEGGDLKIGTDDKSVAMVAREIIRCFGLSPKDGGNVKERIVGGHVFVGSGNLGEKLEETRQEFPRPPFVVSDSLVGPLYRDRLGETRGFFLLPRGEEAKSLFWVEKLYSAFAEAEVDRGDVIVALGGGCVGDAAGFAASTWMRGVPVIQCPTTLLAQVDSAIGGKVGVNLREGKNLAGAFHQPLAVISDVQCLLTLPREHYRQGLAEAVKYGLGEDPDLFAWLERNAKALLGRDERVLAEMVSRCAAIKTGIVERDEKETGNVRERLNLGHTVGHGLEAASEYSGWNHGDAVAVGMVVASHLSCIAGLCGEDTVKRLMELLTSLGFSLVPDRTWQEILPYLARDKKFRGGRFRLVLPEATGRAAVREDVPIEGLRQAYEEVLSWSGVSTLPC